MNDSLFENFGGAVDISVTSVVATGGNIRNCGTGLRTFASGKITTKNNILGPSDEFIPSPDIFDSDFNSVNLTLNSDDLLTPIYLYIAMVIHTISVMLKSSLLVLERLSMKVRMMRVLEPGLSTLVNQSLHLMELLWQI